MKILSKFILTKCLGWKIMEPIAPDKKCVILGAPHTSMMDFLVSWLYYDAIGGDAYVLMKKELFKGPLKPILKAMGGIPVDRKKSAILVKDVIKAFNSKESMQLAIAPEGTRKRTTKWKAGFYVIAKAAKVPVYLGYFDWGKKEVGRGERIELTDDARADLKRIRQWYKDKGIVGKHPEMFTTGDDLK
ncbi:MAG: 1-acyl-sn-glycerol-3-phosphate acyltransferase [Bacteroidetes bacterium]|nr:1-acyl-sn-glycerol-3-phosphate acyltransferase [Bacteroidota bacterium]